FGYANTHNVGRGARSPYLLTGLIHCSHCGHKWFGYTVNSGRKRKDGSNSKTLYYACGGYVGKGKSVCPRRVVRKEWLEGWVVGKIEEMLKKYFGKPEGLEKIRRMVEEEINDIVPQIGEELDQVAGRIQEVKQTISNLIENLTSTNREYVDARLVELKRELAVLESKRLELEAAGAKKLEINRLIDQAVELAGEFKTAFAEGTIEEKRLFLRAFLKGIKLNPVARKGQVTFILFPGREKTAIKISTSGESELSQTCNIHFG
ncbi:MAG: zinc ribbon domain-containing protein, partial [Candidatus Hatepunaea meridiana]|nr:zinc ribbon domain-containing protein [Candidatus Hatepunaea meridiana]